MMQDKPSFYNDFHKTPPTYRIAKRLVLNQCFRKISKETNYGPKIEYITLGGEHVYDLMDLLAVMSVRDYTFSVVSFEKDSIVAKKAQASPVCQTLNKINTVQIKIVHADFPSSGNYLNNKSRGDRIFFLDYTKTFNKDRASDIKRLLLNTSVKNGDCVMITSGLSPRIVRQKTYLREEEMRFGFLFPGEDFSADAKESCHVELHLDCALGQYQSEKSVEKNGYFCAVLIEKMRYNDTGTPMGVWIFQLKHVTNGAVVKSRISFTDFPHDFQADGIVEQVPDIFQHLKN
jgi:hypothetical protein